MDLTVVPTGLGIRLSVCYTFYIKTGRISAESSRQMQA